MCEVFINVGQVPATRINDLLNAVTQVVVEEGEE